MKKCTYCKGKKRIKHEYGSFPCPQCDGTGEWEDVAKKLFRKFTRQWKKEQKEIG